MGAGLAVLALVAVVLLAMELVSRSLPHWIDNSASKARNLFEVLYFIAGVTLPVIAVVALLVARNQVAFAREQNRIAERSSLGASYIDLFEKIIESFRKIQPLILSLPAAYRTARETGSVDRTTSEGAYICQLMMAWSDRDADNKAAIIGFLVDLENLGLLVRMKYISFDAIHYLLEGPLREVTRVFGHYIQSRKDGSPDERLWEHAHWLLLESRDRPAPRFAPSEGRLS